MKDTFHDISSGRGRSAPGSGHGGLPPFFLSGRGRPAPGPGRGGPPLFLIADVSHKLSEEKGGYDGITGNILSYPVNSFLQLAL